MPYQFFRLPHLLDSSPLKLAALACLLCLPLSPAAYGGWNILGQNPMDPGVDSDGRVGDGAVFTIQNPSVQFTVDSSLDQNKWWTSSSAQPWGNEVTYPSAGGHLGMRVDEAIDPGGSFFVGLSFSNIMTDLKHAFRIRYGAADLARPPDGTQIFLGYTNAGTPSGVSLDDHAVSNPAQGLQNAVPLAPNNSAPPASAFPASFVSAYSWVAVEQAFGSGPSQGDPQNNTTRVVIDTGGDDIEITEIVIVIVLPDGQTFPSPSTENERMHFSWTIDGNGAGSVGPLNPNSGDLLIPEPGRTMLLGLAFALLLLRRSRPR